MLKQIIRLLGLKSRALPDSPARLGEMSFISQNQDKTPAPSEAMHALSKLEQAPHPELIREFTRYFEGNPGQVLRAYLFQILSLDPKTPTHLAVGLVVSDAPRFEAEHLASMLDLLDDQEERGLVDEFSDLYVLNDDPRMERAIREFTEPFYTFASPSEQ